MTLIPSHADVLRRVRSGELADGADDHKTFCMLRTMRGRGLVAHVGDGRPRWIVTQAGEAALADDRGPRPALQREEPQPSRRGPSMPDAEVYREIRRSKALAGG